MLPLELDSVALLFPVEMTADEELVGDEAFEVVDLRAVEVGLVETEVEVAVPIEVCPVLGVL
jgi:hypothetical protein